MHDRGKRAEVCVWGLLQLLSSSRWAALHIDTVGAPASPPSQSAPCRPPPCRPSSAPDTTMGAQGSVRGRQLRAIGLLGAGALLLALLPSARVPSGQRMQRWGLRTTGKPNWLLSHATAFAPVPDASLAAAPPLCRAQWCPAQAPAPGGRRPQGGRAGAADQRSGRCLPGSATRG